MAELLNTLHIPRFTKLRARRSNDNALVEGKNAHVVRKWFGHDHIPQRFAEAVNEFALRELSPFLNFHRPCLIGTEYRDDRGRVRRKYRRADVMTPYAKLKSLPGAGACLKDGATFAELDWSALAVSDLDAVGRVNDARRTCSAPSISHRPARRENVPGWPPTPQSATRGCRAFRMDQPRFSIMFLLDNASLTLPLTARELSGSLRSWSPTHDRNGQISCSFELPRGSGRL